ncbi:MAG TPA: sugar transferase [Oligoflexia bacterium]|nr:sugar transferase [Oligoflexia bacterium]HMP47963.1 sugar transferase [Oligoflexia bacterium]
MIRKVLKIIKYYPWSNEYSPEILQGKDVLEVIEVDLREITKEASLSSLLYDASKRFMDIFISLAILIFAVPIMIVLSILIRLSSPGPAIYCQKRLTTGGRVFTIFKFRTMVSDAETSSGAVWASKNDPRITSLGMFMRKTRLDELPQLINVLIGDMSLIGPRPERPEFARKLQSRYPGFKKRYQVPAGLSGLAQVSAEYADSIDSYKLKLIYDLIYVKNRSLLLDTIIALKTIYVMVSGRGAR